jgi:hypothetical protein
MTIQLTGELLIAGRAKRGEGAPFQALDAATGEPIEHFPRPVCYQNLADNLLPDALRDARPLALRRRFADKPETQRTS